MPPPVTLEAFFAPDFVRDRTEDAAHIGLAASPAEFEKRVRLERQINSQEPSLASPNNPS